MLSGGEYCNFRTFKKVKGQLSLDEFTRSLDDKQLPEVCEKLIAAVEEKEKSDFDGDKDDEGDKGEEP